jgi:lipoate-protein ligase B
LNAYWLDLGFLEYTPAFSIQEQVLEARQDGLQHPTIILQENPPTFTIGRSGAVENILLTPNECLQRGIKVLEVNRGGDVTYHGPGQLIASPLLYLGDIGLNANQYLHRLEDILIQILEEYGIQAGKISDSPGVWVGEAKIASVGIAVRHGYTFHGLSLNVNLDLMPFNWIHPCGFPHLAMTSMQLQLGEPVSMVEVKEHARRAIGQAFDLQFMDIHWPELKAQYSK